MGLASWMCPGYASSPYMWYHTNMKPPIPKLLLHLGYLPILGSTTQGSPQSWAQPLDFGSPLRWAHPYHTPPNPGLRQTSPSHSPGPPLILDSMKASGLLPMISEKYLNMVLFKFRRVHFFHGNPTPPL